MTCSNQFKFQVVYLINYYESCTALAHKFRQDIGQSIKQIVQNLK